MRISGQVPISLLKVSHREEFNKPGHETSTFQKHADDVCERCEFIFEHANYKLSIEILRTRSLQHALVYRTKLFKSDSSLYMCIFGYIL